ncbi:crotonase/enoyl-CoA hydratase family protein [uncultured Roseobacter sp.]|uniref:crotonase/enoyl-CoA hydratase family protein n=1 Tax=uncultured Roseobacter sp. TaxID=114847 RepID=UPI002603C627|nr:crotonase/enoyl-CoA hydratase family protein [uncultured Roseobacter sp.]
MFETLELEKDARGVASLRLNRPEKHNAMSARMLEELSQAAAELGADPSVRVVVLSGTGRSFCAGGDLAWMAAQREMDGPARMAEARKLADMLGALNALPKPLIGAVQGNAFGGGVGLACVCDVAVAAQGARFGFTETRLGLIPATIGPYVLARMGEGRARRVFMSSRLFDAAEAVDLGILARAVPEEALAAAVEAEVAPYLACAPGAVAAAKALARDLGARVDAAQVERSVAALAAQWETPEAAEGIAAFFDKRKASWVA